MIISCLLVLTGCSTEPAFSAYEEESDQFVQILDHEYLYYDKLTKVVYVIFNNTIGTGDHTTGYGYMSPYYSENGKLQRYINGELIEIGEDENDESN